jgi:hypothetical protein
VQCGAPLAVRAYEYHVANVRNLYLDEPLPKGVDEEHWRVYFEGEREAYRAFLQLWRPWSRTDMLVPGAYERDKGVDGLAGLGIAPPWSGILSSYDGTRDHIACH